MAIIIIISKSVIWAMLITETEKWAYMKFDSYFDSIVKKYGSVQKLTNNLRCKYIILKNE